MLAGFSGLSAESLKVAGFESLKVAGFEGFLIDLGGLQNCRTLLQVALMGGTQIMGEQWKLASLVHLAFAHERGEQPHIRRHGIPRFFFVFSVFFFFLT